MARGKLITELYLTKNQVNALMYVLDNYLNSKTKHRYVEYAEKMKRKVLNFGRAFNNKGDEMLALHMYDTDFTVIIKLLTTFISVIPKNPKDYFSEIVASKK